MDYDHDVFEDSHFCVNHRYIVAAICLVFGLLLMLVTKVIRS